MEGWKVFRNASRVRILQKWRSPCVGFEPITSTSTSPLPDPLVRIEETARRCIHFSSRERSGHRSQQFFSRPNGTVPPRCALHVLQPPYNYLSAASRPISFLLPQQQDRNLRLWCAVPRSSLWRMRPNTVFDGDDLRRADPKFLKPRLPISGRRGTARPARAQRFASASFI